MPCWRLPCLARPCSTLERLAAQSQGRCAATPYLSCAENEGMRCRLPLEPLSFDTRRPCRRAAGALTFYLWRNEIALCARLLGLSASALVDNPGLILFVIGAQARLAACCLRAISEPVSPGPHAHSSPYVVSCITQAA